MSDAVQPEPVPVPVPVPPPVCAYTIPPAAATPIIAAMAVERRFFMSCSVVVLKGKKERRNQLGVPSLATPCSASPMPVELRTSRCITGRYAFCWAVALALAPCVVLSTAAPAPDSRAQCAQQ